MQKGFSSSPKRVKKQMSLANCLSLERELSREENKITAACVGGM
jgi:hypothetical protein